MESVAVPGPQATRGGRIVAALLALGLVAVFALDGPTGPLALASLGLALGVAFLFVPADARPYAYPLLGVLILLGQFAPGYAVFDPIPVVLAGVAFIDLAFARRRQDWEFHLPAWLCVGLLAVPLLAVPTVVVSVTSFIGGYKAQVLWVLLFFALRRLVPPARSQALLWIFPVIGILGALQLLQKTSGLGALLFARMSHRNFYTRLPWGQSDFLAAALEFCLCMTIVLIQLERRPAVRVGLGIGCFVILQALLLLFSRAGAVALGVFALIIVLGLGGRRGLAAAGAAVGVGLASLATPGGQTLIGRFTDPGEYLSWYYRLVVWENSWRRFLAHPFTGIGMNQGRYVHDFQGGDPANNLILDPLMEQGIFAAIVLAVIFLGAFRMAARVTPRESDANPRTVRVVLIAALSQLVVHGMGEPTISGPAIAFPLVFLFVWLSHNDAR